MCHDMPFKIRGLPYTTMETAANRVTLCMRVEVWGLEDMQWQ